VLFVFPILSSMKKAVRQAIEEGEIVYKPTKPDLQDNLMKILADSMNGIVFVDDSRICKVASQKIYGLIPRTEVIIKPL
jgi:Holliday junction resolvase RusA-like endonuclease